jgi:hypothetical protein
MASYAEELNSVRRMLDLAGLVPELSSDPMTVFGEETGVDVLCRIDGREIGIQVTDYTPGYGLQNPPDSASRAEEKKLAAQNPRGYGFGVSAEYIRALTETLKTKLQKTFSGVDEGWLLIAAQHPQYGRTFSTFVSADHIDIGRMNAEIHPLLAGKQYAKVFLLLATDGVLFEWNPTDRWHLSVDRRSRVDPQQVEELRSKLFPKGK